MIIVGLVAVLLGGAQYAAAWRRSREVRWRAIPSASLSIEARQVGRNALAFFAKACNVGVWHKPTGRVWWRAEVSYCPDEGGHSVVWSHEFNEPENVRRIAGGGPVAIKLPDQVVPMDLPPGSYHVLIEVREDTPVRRRDGSREGSIAIVGESKYIDIEALR
jgi:hypothetical protein